jgi:Trk-type K+ transport system membrane component
VPLFIRTELLKEEIQKHYRDDDKKLIQLNLLKWHSMKRLGKIILFFLSDAWILGPLNLHELIYNCQGNFVVAFNNAGTSLFSANLVPFQGDFVILLVIGMQILLGNTMFPVELRWVIKLLRKYSKSEESRQELTWLHPSFP